VDGNSFKQYIGFDELSDHAEISEDDKNFVRLLYSETNLDADISVGFKGNPNMGSIVLNQFTNSEDFKRFGQTFAPGDAVFIVNSIFGGTGAAGFPLLLKNLRGNSEIPHRAQIKDAPIGGITYLPYFSLNKHEEINSESFEEKSKVAIDYYNRTIIGQHKINVLYLIGNKGNTNILQYAVGGKDQKNNAHFLELAGALAVMDFCKNIQLHQVNDAKATHGTQVKELTRFKIYTEYLNQGLPRALNVSRWTRSNLKLVPKMRNSALDKNYFGSVEYSLQVKAFNMLFDEWMRELNNNKPAFSPFHEITPDNALNLVKNKPAKGDASFKALDIENCRLIDRDDIRSSPDKKHTALIKLFGLSTKNVLNRKVLIIH
jgi:hypothetical protein